jgi:hypothetical protein
MCSQKPVSVSCSVYLQYSQHTHTHTTFSESFIWKDILPPLSDPSSLQTKASETVVTTHKTAVCQNPQDRNIRIYPRDKLKFHRFTNCSVARHFLGGSYEVKKITN